MPITALPTAPSRALRPADFANQADAFLAALPTFPGTEATALEVNVNAKEASAAAATDNQSGRGVHQRGACTGLRGHR